MRLFGRNRISGSSAGPVTAIVSAEGERWRVTWIAAGKNEPPELEAAGLTDALHDLSGQAPDAELQFAIFPWDYGKRGAIYDISGGAGRFMARDIQGSDTSDKEIEAASLDGLVEAVRQQPGGSMSMLRWVRPFGEL